MMDSNMLVLVKLKDGNCDTKYKTQYANGTYTPHLRRHKQFIAVAVAAVVAFSHCAYLFIMYLVFD